MCILTVMLIAFKFSTEASTRACCPAIYLCTIIHTVHNGSRGGGGGARGCQSWVSRVNLELSNKFVFRNRVSFWQKQWFSDMWRKINFSFSYIQTRQFRPKVNIYSYNCAFMYNVYILLYFVGLCLILSCMYLQQLPSLSVIQGTRICNEGQTFCVIGFSPPPIER